MKNLQPDYIMHRKKMQESSLPNLPAKWGVSSWKLTKEPFSAQGHGDFSASANRETKGGSPPDAGKRIVRKYKIDALNKRKPVKLYNFPGCISGKMCYDISTQIPVHNRESWATVFHSFYCFLPLPRGFPGKMPEVIQFLSLGKAARNLRKRG